MRAGSCNAALLTNAAGDAGCGLTPLPGAVPAGCRDPPLPAAVALLEPAQLGAPRAPSPAGLPPEGRNNPRGPGPAPILSFPSAPRC